MQLKENSDEEFNNENQDKTFWREFHEKIRERKIPLDRPMRVDESVTRNFGLPNGIILQIEDTGWPKYGKPNDESDYESCFIKMRLQLSSKFQQKDDRTFLDTEEYRSADDPADWLWGQNPTIYITSQRYGDGRNEMSVDYDAGGTACTHDVDPNRIVHTNHSEAPKLNEEQIKAILQYLNSFYS